MKTRILIWLALIVLLVTTYAYGVNICAVSGTVQNPDGSGCANCLITVNSIKPQTVSGQVINPTMISSSTDASGNLTAFNVAQGLAVQITITTANGTTGTPFTAIIPFSASVGFSALAIQSNITGSTHLNDLLPPTGAVNFNGQNLTNGGTIAGTNGTFSGTMTVTGLGTFGGLSSTGHTSITGNQTNGADVINSVNLNGRIDPRTYGAFFNAKGYAAGTTTASSTTFTDTTNSPFVAGDVGKLIIIYEAAKYADWPGAAQPCVHGTCIQPTTNNAGNLTYCAKNWSTGITGGAAPAFNQSISSVSVITTDNTCTWENSFNVNGVYDTGAPLVTTITGFTSSSQVTLGNQASWAINGTATYVYGSDDKAGIQAAINAAAAVSPNGGGVVQFPCGNATAGTTGTGMLSGELTMSAQGVWLMGCGWGSLESSTGPLGPGILWASRTGAVPVIRINSSYEPIVQNIRFKGNSAFPPSAIIEMCDNGTSTDGFACTDTPPNRMWRIQDVYIGDRGPFMSEHDEFAGETKGISFIGSSNNQPGFISNVHINAFTTGAVDNPLTQSISNVYENTYVLSTGGLANYGFRFGGHAVLQAPSILGLTAESTNIGGTNFDLLNGADVTVNGQTSEGSAREVVCDMNGGGSLLSRFTVHGKYFQTQANVTASDGILFDCGPAAPGGAVVGQNQAFLDGIAITDNASSFGTGWTADYRTTGANSAALLNIKSNPVGPIGWGQIQASTGTASAYTDISLDGNDTHYGPRTLHSYPNGVFGALNYNEEHLNTQQLDSGSTYQRLQAPIVGSACTVTTAGASTCKYVVTALDGNGGETPASGIITCASSAALASQNNTVHVQIVPGAASYNFYGDNCSGGAQTLLNNTVASTTSLYAAVANQVSLQDNAITRGSANPPTTNMTGGIANPYNITGIGAAPANNGDVLSMGRTIGQTTFAKLPTYPNTVSSFATPAVYLRMDQASGNFTDSSGNANTCVSSVGGITYQQTGAITDDPDTAALFTAASSGQCTVATAASMPAGDTVSCAAWVKFTAVPATKQEILGQKTGGLNFFVSATGGIVGTLQLQKDSSQIAGTQPYNIGDTNYHLVGFTKNAATTSRIYIDGVNRTQVFSNQTLAPTDGTLYVAAQTASANFLGGDLDEVACWTVALTDAQWSQLYQEGVAAKNGTLIYDTTDKCLAKYVAGAWADGDCGVRTVGAGSTQQPACAAGLQGWTETVTDSNTAVWGATLTSGGGNVVGGYCDGTNWTVFAK